ncbi:LysR family transcriptional regulator [Paenibacillus harenae]|uniref:LysR family transcriptional regulator n=1 Tax=Paenibacillus harenae TaxID=306543 RepID=UPI00279059E9|nr:LysR family transcriptional regulator [Paenibacillus harenae]MDQ0062819.1 DNA-binding transcriptional LysR family regulator [Paenibacillus harenae]
MDLKAIKSFQLIVAYGSFKRAAEELNYAQSTVTMQIQRLEADLGVQLIERGTKIGLTEAGRMFYEQSLPIAQDLERLQSTIADARSGEAGHIRLGVNEPTASYRLPPLLSAFMADYPRIRIAVEIAGTPSLSERLQQGELDMAICSVPELGDRLCFEPLFTEPFALLLPEKHPLAGTADIALTDIQGHRLLITSANCPYRKQLSFLLQRTETTLSDTVEIGSMAALPYYVACGFGIALVPLVVLNPPPAGTVIRKVNNDGIHMTIGLACRAEQYPLKPAASKLYRYLKQELQHMNQALGIKL